MTHTRLAFYAICLLLLAACDDNSHSATNPENHPYIPEAPDYTDAAMWYTRENHATEEGADVFYLVLHLGDRLDHGRWPRLPLCRRA